MKYEKQGKIKTMLDKVNKKPKKVIMDKPKTTPKPTTKVKTMVKKAERPPSVAKDIYDRTTKDMIKKNIEKIRVRFTF